MFNKRFLAVLMLLVTVSSWGGMFHVAKATLPVIDAFWLAVVRYSFTAVFFALLLIWREGTASLRFDGQGLAAWWYGTLGFGMFNYFVFFGLNYSPPEHGAVIMALMPLIAAIVNWVSTGERPPGYTLVAIGVAFAGVVLVITQGDISTLLYGESAFGDALMLMGSVAWVLYTRSATRFSHWSPLRFTTLTTLAGTSSILFITGTLTLFNIAHVPDLSLLPDLTGNIIYIIVLATIVAVLFWNQGIRVMGVLNGMLFINLVPVSAFIIGLSYGNELHPVELIGAALTLTALVANNLLARRQQSMRLAVDNG
jgi:drug/metabolite transporter (DMT)-like permease